MRILILLLLVSFNCFGQLDSLQTEYIYLTDSMYQISKDSTNLINLYPRDDALNYRIYSFEDTALNKYAFKIDKPTEKWLKNYILDTVQWPVMKILFDSINSDTALKNKVVNQIKDHDWNPYVKNDNVWMFNADTTESRRYKSEHLLRLDSVGGKAWNFDMYMYVPYARMGNSYDGFTVRQICNSSELILKRKDTGLIIIRLRRKNGDYFTWADMLGMNGSWWTLTSYYEIDDMLDSIDICIVSDVDEDTTGCTPLENMP